MPELDEADRTDGRRQLNPLPEGYALRVYPIDESDEIRLLDLWRTMWGGRWLILSAAILGAVAATALALLITPKYRAEVVMAPVSTDRNSGGLASLASGLGGLSGLASLAGINLGTDNSTAEAIATLGSRAFTESFIEKHNLLPVLFADDWDEAKGKWDVDDPDDIPTPWRAYDRFDKSIRTLTQDAETGLVTLTIDWTDPKVATSWANGLVEEVNAKLRNRAIEESKKNVAYLREQLQSTSEVEVRDAVFGLMEAEMKNAMLSTVRTEYAFEVIDPAIVPEKSYWPNLWLFAVLGLSAGLLLGVAVVLVRRSAAT